MKKWTLLEQVALPSGALMTLNEHDGAYAIRVDGRELMSSRHHLSEARLAEVACAPFTTRVKARVLIGGLGLGFTLKAALATLGRDAEVVVAELVPEVLAWNKDERYGLASAAVADRRTRIELKDVAQIVTQSHEAFDAIMLDADNNTTAANNAGNRSLYEAAGLQRVLAALKPGGRVVYWSADQDPLLAKRLSKAGFRVETERTRTHENAGGLHHLLIGDKLQRR